MILRDFLWELVHINAPSGFESDVAERLAEELKASTDQIEKDAMGNLIAIRKGAEPSILVACHMDEVGMFVEYVEANFVYFKPSGLLEVDNLFGVPMTILTEGGPVTGITRSPYHHLSFMGESVPKTRNWIDIAGQKGVKPGDPIVFAPNALWLDKQTLASKAIDPRAACAAMVESAHILKSKDIKNTIYFVGLVREEVGSLGSQYLSAHLKPNYAIVIDMWFGDDASIPKGLGRPLDGGPVIFRFIRSINDAMMSIAHPRVVQALSMTAEELNQPYSYGIISEGYDDLPGIQQGWPAVIGASVGIPRRYSHCQFEVVDLRTIAHTANMVAGAVEKLSRAK